jgi:Cu2+-exporting ATPase
MNDTTLACDHCELPIPPGELVADRIGDLERRFCCQGCRGAFRIITGAGMDDFYRRRNWPEPGLPEGAFSSGYDDAALAPFVSQGERGAEFSFLLEGVRCASCVWLIERILASVAGVSDARLNYGTHRARVRFDPNRTTPAALFEAVARIGYIPRPYTVDAQQTAADNERRSLLIRFGTAFFLSMQLMGYSLALYAGYFQGIDEGARNLLQYLAALVTTPVVFYAGGPFLAGAWRSLRNRAPNMDLLIAIGVLSAYGYSLYALKAGGEIYFDTAAMIVTLILAGRLFENAARRKASAGVDRLLRLAPDNARRLEGEDIVQVESSLLHPGDRIRVLPGERFPVDGELISGDTEVDESVVTGEPLPVLRSAGAKIVSGALNLTAAVDLRVTRGVSDSFIARVAHLVEEAQSRQAPVQRLADRVAALFVPAAAMLSLGTLLYWSWQGEPGMTPLLNAVAVLVVACPCALGLATPTAILVAGGAAASRGILFRGGDVIEAAGRLTIAAFDKTGTLTEGRPRVAAIRPATGTEGDLLNLAARVEAGSAHPLARGIVTEARRRGLAVESGSGSRAIAGRGAWLETQEGPLRVGSRLFLSEAGIAVPSDDAPDHCTEVHVACGESYCGVILLEDPVRTSAEDIAGRFGALGIRTALLTGDRHAAAERISKGLRIGTTLAELSPQEKSDWIEARMQEGERVLMVGDGINDAPALSAASVGCAMAGGTDIALETSDLILTRPDLECLEEALRIARRTLRIIRQNLFWAFAYNLLALPLAAAGKLAPIHAAAAMALSSVCVVGNSLRLAKVKGKSNTENSCLATKTPSHQELQKSIS